jgi:hypothetical protein
MTFDKLQKLHFFKREDQGSYSHVPQNVALFVEPRWSHLIKSRLHILESFNCFDLHLKSDNSGVPEFLNFPLNRVVENRASGRNKVSRNSTFCRNLPIFEDYQSNLPLCYKSVILNGVPLLKQPPEVASAGQ